MWTVVNLQNCDCSFFFPLKNLNGASHQNSEQKSKGSKQIVFFLKDSNKRRNTLVNSYFMFDYPNFFFLFGQYYPNFIFLVNTQIFFKEHKSEHMPKTNQACVAKP